MKKTLIIIPIVSLFVCGVFCINNVMAETRETWISDNAHSYCEEIGNQYNICPELLMAVIETESSGQATARNGSCIGLMQYQKHITVAGCRNWEYAICMPNMTIY